MGYEAGWGLGIAMGHKVEGLEGLGARAGRAAL